MANSRKAVPPDMPGHASETRLRGARAWFERLWSSIADRGHNFAPIPANSIEPIGRAKLLATSLLSERGEASGAAIARELLSVLSTLDDADRMAFFVFLAEEFQPDPDRLRKAASDYIADPSPESAIYLAERAEPPRQELLRRMNMASGGTAALVEFRREIADHLLATPPLKMLDWDLHHLLTSWFNRGFLELRRIDWQTPAAILEKLITYEAVHEIHGWEDLRRRLAADRRCFGFFHPALPGEPLIFVEVALVKGLAASVNSLLERDADEAAQRQRVKDADTAIFYSISNCQEGLRGISFGNFLIKQVVEELRGELPGLTQFSTLSPVPGLRRWLERHLSADLLREIALTPDELAVLFKAADMPPDPEKTLQALRSLAGSEAWTDTAALTEAARPLLLRLCTVYLTNPTKAAYRPDPVARFHLGNGARLERVNWMGNPSRRGLEESFGIMVNYLYDPLMIEANHEAFIRNGMVARSPAVDALLAVPAASQPASGAWRSWRPV